jgi:hypothetical protein
MLALAWCAYVAFWFARVVLAVITMDFDEDY